MDDEFREDEVIDENLLLDDDEIDDPEDDAEGEDLGAYGFHEEDEPESDY